MNENEELQSGFPDWLTEDYKVLEPVFCRTFLQGHPMRYIRGRFYTVDGLVADESSLKKKIYEPRRRWPPCGTSYGGPESGCCPSGWTKRGCKDCPTRRRHI